jgi:hypothetical protein
VGTVLGIIFLVTLPMLSGIGRQFLCSTAWAKEQGFAPEHLNLFSLRGNNLWKGLAVLLVLLSLVFVQHEAITRYLGLSDSPHQAQNQTVPAPQKRTQPQPVFGPVVERTINRASTGTNFLLSFKTGDLRTPPPESASPAVALHTWAQREGLDAAVGVLNGDNDVMTGFDLAVLPAPAQCWEELMPADAAARLESQPASSFVILFHANGSSPETCLFRTRDGGIGILQLTGYASEPPGVKIRYKFVDKVPAPAQTESNAVATGSWSPTLWPGEKPDLGKILDEAEKLTATAHFEEALQRYLWYHGHAREFGGSASDYSLLSHWVELGRRYPTAKQALMKIRDQAASEFQNGGGYSELFQKVALINAQLQNDEATYALFKSIQDQDPSLARQCYYYAESLLVKYGDYVLCLNYLGDPQQKYDQARNNLERERGFYAGLGSPPVRSARFPTNGAAGSAPGAVPAPIDTSAMMKRSSEDRFVGRVCQLIEILVGAAHKADAEKIRDQAVTVLDDARLRSAVSDAEERVRKVRASPRSMAANNAARPTVPLASVNTNFAKPSASVERWAPSLGREEKPNLERIRQEANDLMAKGNYEDALQRHLWYHNHALEYDAGQTGVRLSFWLSDWVELGRRYPKARQALLEVRALKTRELAEGRGYSALFQDVASINSYLQADDETYALFKTIKQRDAALARQCYFYLGDPQSRFASSRRVWEMDKQRYQQQQQFRQEHPLPGGIPAPPDRMREADKRFVGRVSQLIEILVGAGHKADAETIRTQALALLDDPRLQSAVSDAEKKIGK